MLAKPKDTTTTHIDHNLLKEIIFLTSLSFILVLIGNLLNMPSNFACVIAGVMLGPSGGNYIKVYYCSTFGIESELIIFLLLYSYYELAKNDKNNLFRFGHFYGLKASSSWKNILFVTKITHLTPKLTLPKVNSLQRYTVETVQNELISVSCVMFF